MIFLIKVTDVMTQKRALKVTDVLTHPGNRCPDICHVTIKGFSNSGSLFKYELNQRRHG